MSNRGLNVLITLILLAVTLALIAEKLMAKVSEQPATTVHVELLAESYLLRVGDDCYLFTRWLNDQPVVATAGCPTEI